MARTCQKCNAKLSAQDRFCPSCGTPVESEASTESKPADNKQAQSERKEAAIHSFSQPLLISAAVLGTTAIVGWVSSLVWGQFGWAWMGLLLGATSLLLSLIMLRQRKEAPVSIKTFVWVIIGIGWVSILVSFFLLMQGCRNW